MSLPAFPWHSRTAGEEDLALRGPSPMWTGPSFSLGLTIILVHIHNREQMCQQHSLPWVQKVKGSGPSATTASEKRTTRTFISAAAAGRRGDGDGGRARGRRQPSGVAAAVRADWQDRRGDLRSRLSRAPQAVPPGARPPRPPYRHQEVQAVQGGGRSITHRNQRDHGLFSALLCFFLLYAFHPIGPRPSLRLEHQTLA